MRRPERWASWPRRTSTRRRRGARPTSSRVGARSFRFSSSSPRRSTRSRSRFAISRRSWSPSPQSFASHRWCGRAPCWSASPRSRPYRGGRLEPPPERGAARTGREREELQPDRGPEVQLPCPSRRAQDSGPAGGRGALQREGRAREHRQGAGEAEAARPREGHAPRLEEGDRPAPRRRRDRDLPGSADLVPVRKFKPESPGRRFMTVSTFDDVTKKKRPEKSLLEPLKKRGGRNH